MTTLHLRKSISRSPLQRDFLFIAVALVCFALSPAPKAFGVTPAPDGGYANGNTAEGQNALFSLTTGVNNTAVGFDALFHNTTGVYNTANGDHALLNNTTGYANTATGFRSLYSNTFGFDNTANGLDALYHNTTGHDNTANGFQALYSNTSGRYNSAIGERALGSNTTGSMNTAVGDGALFSNTTGNSNIALGDSAGVFITTGSNNIDIGRVGNPDELYESNTIRIGTAGTQTATFIAGVSGATTGLAGVPVLIDANGQLGTMSSSRRFKREIKRMDKASEAILALKPVTFHYKSDKTNRAEFGLIAEEVVEVNPDLVVRDKSGEIYTVRYEAVNAMLLNEVLKEHKKVEEQATTIAQQRKDFQASIIKLEATVAQQQKDFQAAAAHQQKQIEALTAGLQRVSAQVERSRPAPQMALNDR